MGKRAGERRKGPKCIAIIGPFASGKTTLFEAILARTGAIPKQGSIAAGTTVGDNTPEARAHQMSTETTFATVNFMGESITFADCPGSIEFSYEAVPILAACDAAIVVAEADDKKIPALQLILRQLDDLGLPRMLFLNKVDKISAGVRDVLKLLQPASSRPLLLRQIPLRKDGIVVGSIDLALERAYVWREYAESEVTAIPDDEKAREVEARFAMLERLADHDDTLMEQLLEEIEPPRDEVFDDLSADLREGAVTPVLIGSAEHGNGILRLLKAIRHDAPDASDTRKRLGVSGSSHVRIMKTFHTPHGGKLSVARILSGTVADGAELAADGGRIGKVSGIYRLTGRDQAKLSVAAVGDTVAFGKLDDLRTGDALAIGKVAPPKADLPAPPEPVYALALRPRERKDDVKLSATLQRMAEEDPSLFVSQNQDTGETVLAGQGEMHLRVATEKLEGRHQIPLQSRAPQVPYRETIRKATQQRGRHKKQSGGHGQFGDVQIEIKPLPRGAGFEFVDEVRGGAIPGNFMPAVEKGVRQGMEQGVLTGHPVVDLKVTVYDGKFHSVDSKEIAFVTAGRKALVAAVQAARPCVLEPIVDMEISAPSQVLGDITGDLAARRAQVSGTQSGADGALTVLAQAPLAELSSYQLRLNAITGGQGNFTMAFSHYEPVPPNLQAQLAAQYRPKDE